MSNLGYFVPLPSMANEPCIYCGEPNCDLLIQEMVPGGGYCLAHEACFEAECAKYPIEEDANG